MKNCLLEACIIIFSVLVFVTGKKTALDPPELSMNDGPLVAVDACTEDYSPCTCESRTQGETYLIVDCNDVPSFAAVQSVFRRTTAQQIKYFYLTVPFSEVNNSIPADLLSGKAAQSIQLGCSSTKTRLTINSNAFNFSQDYAGRFSFSDCDLSQLNYSFLTNFNVLTQLHYFTSINIPSQWQSLPSLPSLVSLSITSSNDFEGFQNLPLTMIPALSLLLVERCPNFTFLPIVPALTMLTIDSCPLFKQWDIVAQLDRLYLLYLMGFNNETIYSALDSIVSSPLVFSIQSLSLTRNGLTQVPPQIQVFSVLQNLYLSANEITTAKNGSLAFATPQLLDLYLSSNGLTTIEPAAFLGDFSASQVRLESNDLRRFESSVFKSMLEEMMTDKGMVYVYDNPFECDCHLAWLIRDNYHLIDRVYGGQCSNGTYFSSLTPQFFANCDTTGANPTTIVPTTTVTSGAATSLFRLLDLVLLVVSSCLLSS